MGLENHKPTIAMVGLQCMYAGVNLSIRASLLQGMSSMVFVVYRQAIAFLLIAPVAYISSRRRNTSSCRMGWKSFWLIFLLALIGITISQNIYFEGIYLASSSTASATGNLVPAITFLVAWPIGLEKVQMGSVRSMAKIFGTLICAVGAICMAFVKGPKLLNAELIVAFDGMMGGGDEIWTSWLLGCLLLIGSTICWSFWLVLQVAASECYPDHLSLTAWLCFIAAVQSAILTFFIEPDPSVWKLDSNLQLISCLYTVSI
ncbi:PREDICTED: WAT1-related protein At4g30420-like [Ipomoea nil]|uniref:WAT1-related protein At4g30420-like n=1 Tax=Ipomoea nil TaxID=35883 RepID=UPI000901FEF3|nr:PREDICTED: WAT1-related protein At4g30420-like [Ipomoea nil]